MKYRLDFYEGLLHGDLLLDQYLYSSIIVIKSAKTFYEYYCGFSYFLNWVVLLNMPLQT